MKGKYVIINIVDKDFMKDEDGNVNYYDSVEDAALVCGMYEFENVWISKLIFNHIEEN